MRKNNLLRGLLIVSGILLSYFAQAQSNPTAQTLPYSQDFSGLAHASTSYPAGWQGWTISTTPGATFNTTGPTADRLLIGSSTANTNSGNVHNYNGKIGFLNTGSLDLTLGLAINTTGLSSVSVSYDVMTIRNPWDGTTNNNRINEVTLQYRIGTSGAWNNVTGVEYQNIGTGQTTAVTTPQNLQTKSTTLPSACNNQAVVQLRWASRQVSGSGGRPSFALDNLNINGSALPPSITVSTSNLPDFGNIPSGSTSNLPSTTFYTVSGSNLTNNIVITAPTHFLVSLTDNGGFTSSLTLAQTSGTVPATSIYVQFAPTTTGSLSGSITNVSGAESQSVSVSGTGTSCPAPTITALGTTTFCSGGSVELVASSGSSYLWSTGATTPNIFATTTGSYSVTVNDGAGCIATSTAVNVVVNNFGVTGTIFSENVGLPTATTLISLYTGWRGYGIYSYTSVSPEADVRSTSGSTGYTGASGGGNVFFTAASPRSFTISGINTLGYSGLTLSFGGSRTNSTDLLLVDVSTDGTNWSPLTITQPVVSPSNTVWSLITVTSGIPSTANLRIRFSKTGTATQMRLDDFKLTGTATSVQITSLTSTTFCSGGSTLLLSNIPSGNSWSPNGEVTQAILVYSPGTFSTTVIDQNGCSGTSNSITTTVLPAPSGYATSASPTCWLGSDGSVEAFISGGTTPYTYSWNSSPTQTTAQATGLAAGDYTVTVTDASGCSVTASATVLDGEQITSTITPTDATCYGSLDGSALATGSSGSAPYTYLWDTDNLSGTSFNVTAGTKSPAHPQFGVGSANGYSINGVEGKELTLVRGVTYTFNVGTTGFPFIVTTDPNGGTLTGEITTGVLNSRTQSGILTFTPDAGLPSVIYYQCSTQLNMGYKINLVNGFSGAALSNVGAGTYTVKVTDANGCSGQNTAVINQPSQIQVNSFSPTSGLSGTSVTILGSGFLGVIDVQFNGISAATFTVDNFFQITAEVPTGAGNGPISVIAGACSAQSATNFSVFSCPTPTINTSGPTTFCSPGSVQLTSSASSGNVWSTGSTANSIIVTATGSYYVTVTDQNSCTATSSIVNVVVNQYLGYAGPAFVESFGTPAANTLVSAYSGWQNNGIYSFTSPSANQCDVRTSTPSSGGATTYFGASGSGNLFFGTATTNPRTFLISDINTEYYSGLSLQFGLYRTNVSGCTSEQLLVEVSSDGLSWTPLTYAQPALNTWTLITPTGTIPAVPNLRLRFSKTSCAQFRIDDIRINGTVNQVSVNPLSSTTFCSGGSVKLISNIPTGNLWSPNGETTAYAIANSDGNYYTTVTGSNGCGSSSSPIQVITIPQPPMPTLACYETATFNTTTCQWDVTGTQPAPPTLACYETATFNTTTCQWDVSGTQPAMPTLACYETASFNTTTCQWDVTGSQPAMPTLACYETATFNSTTCQWDVTGTPQINITTATACASYTWSYNNVTYNASGSYTVAGTLPCTFEVLDLTINSCGSTLTLTMLINGYLDSPNSMQPKMFYSGASMNATDVEDITVSLVDLNGVTVESHSGVLQTDGSLSVNFSSIGNYWIKVTGPNLSETWSASDITFSGVDLNYDFTSDAAQAFVSNQIETSPGSGIWSMLNGNVVQDGAIDGGDTGQIDFDIYNGNAGYIASDVTGDGNVDASDLGLVDFNIYYGLGPISPF